jgi:magnesium-transporting ATPase (P-type)
MGNSISIISNPQSRWSYRRISKLILYSFYKNSALYLTQFFFIFFNGFSGASVHDRWTISFYNVLFTSMPIMCIAWFDRDVKSETAEDYPELYKQGHKRKFVFSSFSLTRKV